MINYINNCNRPIFQLLKILCHQLYMRLERANLILSVCRHSVIWVLAMISAADGPEESSTHVASKAGHGG